MGYWDEVKDQWTRLSGQYQPPSKGTGSGSGTGPGGPGTGGAPPRVPGKEWEQVYKKFRQVNGREPYSFQELQDWWAV